MYEKGALDISDGVSTFNAEKGQVYLEHSCDDWCIGGKAEVEQMILDLSEILKKL